MSSPEHRAYLRRLRLQRVAVLGAQLLLLAVVLLLWEAAADRYWVNPMLTSKPTKVWETLVRLAGTGTLWRHLGVTLQETLVGFAAGLVLGVGTAVALWWWAPLERVLDPYLVVLNALPKVALGPIFYVWLGDRISIYGMAVAISVVVTIVMVEVAFRSVDPAKILLLQTLGATRRQVLQKVVFPASLPTLLAALKVNIGLTLVGVVVGEFIASKAGLGYLIVYGGQVFQMELVMTGVVVLVAISAALYLAVSWLEAVVTRRFHLRPKDA
ncbi:MAG TPA: ABC transporter permease [Symbiobacteriaceae bacterium]|nr:ABC transporter permease [Symbiobacteriaceae bacterium]